MKQPKGVRTGGSYIRDPETGKVERDDAASTSETTEVSVLANSGRVPRGKSKSKKETS